MATPTTLPATFVSGAVLTAAQMNDLRGAFRVLQVKYFSTSTGRANSTTDFSDTNLTGTITPSSTTSQILVMVCQAAGKIAGDGDSACILRLNRGGTTLIHFGHVGFTQTSLYNWSSGSVVYVDSPATTASTTYKTMFRNRVAASGAEVQPENTASTMVLMEISA